MRIIRILTLLMFYFLPLSLKAGAADTISYSGRIVNSDGSPRTGVVELEISFHSEETGGTAKGTALTPFTVSLVNGFFNLELNISSQHNAILDPSTETWIEVEDLTNQKVYPRQKISSVPYAQEALGLAGHSLPSSAPGDGNVLKWDASSSSWIWGSTGESLDTTDISDFAITSAKLANGSVTNDKLAGSIEDSKLSQITTLNKVANSATSATSSNTDESIVLRGAGGNFAAGTITADLNGNATSASTAATVTTNANLVGDITSVGNTTTITPNTIVDADISPSAAISDSKLSQITSVNKVANSATSATSSNTDDSIVLRGAGGNFAAGTITASKVTGLSTPSADTDAATKAYVDAAVGSSGGLKFLGYSAPTTGNMGRIKGANEKCADAFPDSSRAHMCSYKEIIKLGSEYTYAEVAWINAELRYNHNGSKAEVYYDDGNILSGATKPSDANCNNWNDDRSMYSGPMLNQDGQMSSGGCEWGRPVACCE